MVKKQLGQMVQTFLEAQKSAAQQPRKISPLKSAKQMSPGHSQMLPRGNAPEDLDNLHAHTAVKLPMERAVNMDRARRSISVEARLAILVEHIAQFNEIPKKYDIKFDLSALTDS